MKKTFVLSLVFGLMLLVSANAMAAVHNFTGDFSNPFLLPDYSSYATSFDGWYYIDKDEPSATIRGTFPKDGNALGFEYFQNDQTFANLTYLNPDSGSNVTLLKGSYLFENDFFVGADFGSASHFSQMTLSPGYRYNLDKNAGYVAGSIDFAANDDYYYDSGIVDYEINARYYTKESRVYGQLVIPNKDVTGLDHTYLYVGGAYQLNNKLIIGGNFTSKNGNSNVELGCSTYFEKLEAEAKYITGDDPYELHLNFIYPFAKRFRAGIEAAKKEHVSDLFLIAKAKYSVDKQNSVVLMHQFKNDSASADAVTYLRWDIAL